MFPQDTAKSKGLFGRTKDALIAAGLTVGSYSIWGNARVLEPETSSEPNVIHAWSGAIPFDQYLREDLKPALNNMTNLKSKSVFAESWSSSLFSNFDSTEKLSDALEGIETTESFDQGHYGLQLKQVTKLIKANQATLKNERDIFFINRGGWDTHSDLRETMEGLLDDVDDSLGDFKREMKALGLWDNVAVVSVSDFGRTLTDNGVGTDHAWGGNNFIVGGAVNGGKILGTFIDDYGEGGSQNIGRGRLVPTTPWESLWSAVITWLGVTDAEAMDKILPNLKNFPDDVINGVKDELFL